MSVVSLPSGRSYQTEPAESLLAAALRAGVNLEHSCRTGRCSSCKAKVSCGQTSALQDELGLTSAERAEGWILTCVREALSDVELDVEDLGDIQIIPPKTIPCRIQALDSLAPDVMRVVLRLPPAQRLDFYAGQYIDVIGPGGVRRSYSVANAPAADNQIELHVRAVPGGAMSQYWFNDAKLNDLLRLNGPLGTFFLRDVAGKHLVFLATGTGIAPVKAMLEGLLQMAAEERPQSVQVYWGGRVPADIYWQPAEAFASLGCRFVPVLSRAKDQWLGECGYVQDALLRQPRGWRQTEVYACGSDAMIHSARTQLHAAGLASRAFHSDAFVCSA